MFYKSIFEHFSCLKARVQIDTDLKYILFYDSIFTADLFIHKSLFQGVTNHLEHL